MALKKEAYGNMLILIIVLVFLFGSIAPGSDKTDFFPVFKNKHGQMGLGIVQLSY